MEFDRNFMGYYPGMNNMPNCDLQYAKCDGKMMHEKMEMPGWVCGPTTQNNAFKYMNPYEQMKPYDNMNSNFCRGDMYMNPGFYMHNHNMEPLDSMCGKTYKVLIVYVNKTVQKIMMENMGVMPKAISKEKYKKEMNDMLCEVMKKEEEIKKLVVVERSETDESENMDRAFCPFCHGMLKDVLGILFITELLKGGCTSCY